MKSLIHSFKTHQNIKIFNGWIVIMWISINTFTWSPSKTRWFRYCPSSLLFSTKPSFHPIISIHQSQKKHSISTSWFISVKWLLQSFMIIHSHPFWIATICSFRSPSSCMWMRVIIITYWQQQWICFQIMYELFYFIQTHRIWTLMSSWHIYWRSSPSSMVPRCRCSSLLNSCRFFVKNILYCCMCAG